MNLLRSVFISLLIPTLILSVILIIKEIFTFGLNIPLVGAALVSIPFLLFFAQAMLMKNMARTSKNLTLNFILAGSGLVLVAISLMFKKEPPVNVDLAAIIAVTNFGLFLIYIFWYSKLTRQYIDEFSVGKRLPDFCLYQSEKTFQSTDFKGQSTVLMFYRGNWCPFCIAQIKELVAAYKNAIHSGIRFVMVSPQPDKFSIELAKKFDVPFLFLRDKDNSAAKTLGLFHKNGLPAGMQVLGYDSDTAMPTVIVTNEKGIVTYLSLTDNYRVRPEVDDFLKLLI